MTVLAADRAHCTPWDLEDQPVYWRERVLMALSAEKGAEAEIQQREARRQRAARNRGGR